MPSAQSIRKRILQFLEANILPALRSDAQISFMVAELPFLVPPKIQKRPLPIPILEQDAGQTMLYSWVEARVSTTASPSLGYIGCIFEGEADLRVGVTSGMLREWSRGRPELVNDSDFAGCYLFALPNMSVVLFPPGTPLSDGHHPHWERPGTGNSRIFWLNIIPSGALCHICSTQGGNHLPEHSLLLQDEGLIDLLRLLQDEMRSRPLGYEELSRTYLLALLLRVHRNMKVDSPAVGNTAWKSPILPDNQSMLEKERSLAASIPGNLHQYIRIHLREPLSLTDLANEARLSPTHLNRLFRSILGVTVMRYLTLQRMEAAKMILVDNIDNKELPIKEVAQLVGYQHVSHFCNVFQQCTGMSPREYQARSQADRLKQQLLDVDNS